MRRASINLPDALYTHIERQARANFRSFSAEVTAQLAVGYAAATAAKPTPKPTPASQPAALA